MCMPYDKKATDAWWEVLKTKGKITVYKVMNKVMKIGFRGSLDSDIFQGYHTWKPGWNHSDRKPKKNGWMITKAPKKDSYGYITVHHGFHVYLDKEQASRDMGFIGSCSKRIVAFTAYKKDFVAASHGRLHRAIFSRLWLSRKEYDKAIGK